MQLTGYLISFIGFVIFVPVIGNITMLFMRNPSILKYKCNSNSNSYIGNNSNNNNNKKVTWNI